jgi:hypothetical protein
VNTYCKISTLILCKFQSFVTTEKFHEIHSLIELNTFREKPLNVVITKRGKSTPALEARKQDLVSGNSWEWESCRYSVTATLPFSLQNSETEFMSVFDTPISDSN